MFPEEIDDLARRVVARAVERGLMIATAESCTGGLVAGALTSVAGSSSAVDRGFVTYSDAAKARMLDVSASTLADHGAVSRATALEMARGAVGLSSAQVSVAVTGVAGPGGGSEEKPVGLVHFSAQGPEGVVHVERRFGDIGREAVRLASVKQALEMLLERLG